MSTSKPTDPKSSSPSSSPSSSGPSSTSPSSSGQKVDQQKLSELLDQLGYQQRPQQLTAFRLLPAQAARYAPWPQWLHPRVLEAFLHKGIKEPYLHQLQAADLIRQGKNLILTTGTGSGKSLAYQLAALDALYRGEEERQGQGFKSGRVSVLYITPTKALAADQLESLQALKLPGLRAASYDGDTPQEKRQAIRQQVNFLLTNPEMLHHSILPHHQAWSSFLGKLSYIIIDEAHTYRGIFGAHCALLLRRLQRICQLYGAQPVFLGASATSADPQAFFARLTGLEEQAIELIDRSYAPQPERQVLLWEPEFSQEQPVKDRLAFRGAAAQSQQSSTALRISALQQTAQFISDLVLQGTRTLAFIRSRRGAELLAQTSQEQLASIDPALSQKVAAYRSGYLAEERRALERDFAQGRLLALASTPALELGIDISGLDAVLLAGWPGSRASFFQEIGRAGRGGESSLAIFIADQDPLDTYLVHHPEDIFDRAPESTVFDPENPYLLGPHLCAAAAEIPLRPEDLPLFGPSAGQILQELVNRRYLRRRATGWFWTHSTPASSLVNFRGGGPALDLIDLESGSLLGSMSLSQAYSQGHPGAVYTHQGKTYLVEELSVEEGVIGLRPAELDYYTQAKEVSDLALEGSSQQKQWGQVSFHYGPVKVSSQVINFQKKSLASHRSLGSEALDLPAQELRSQALYFSFPLSLVQEAGLSAEQLPGALHAIEHAAIGLLPLLASCDRWDLGGLSRAFHPDTQQPSIFIYDTHPGGAGFSQKGFEDLESWLLATFRALLACDCERGCPSCVHSPQCGSRNEPLDKQGAVLLLGRILLEGSVLEGQELEQLLASWPLQGAERGPSVVQVLTGTEDLGAPY
ncbi:MAG: DEAD/DEAH box helicase [Rothia sp. (in: high G+C Gram-positive bacteria)]|nr:DEAD/DEAH box helicase [Rothia sp. (in: high G+C Gram-positive bacteria)]